MVLQGEIIFKGYLSLFGSWSYLNFFEDGMGSFKLVMDLFLLKCIYPQILFEKGRLYVVGL